ncbi:hypothetical protein V8D89_009678 [Ganoderma adspersum]
MSKPQRSKSKETTAKSDSAPSLPTVAPYPFNQSSANITLRTPDRVDFYVHSHILSQASPVFADMFSLPQPSSILLDGDIVRPIVDVTEDNRTIRRLLCICYPIEKENLDGLEDIVPVLEAAMKYDMKWPISLLTTNLRTMIPRSPLEVWAASCRCGLKTLAQEAATTILRKAQGQSESQPPPPSPSVPPLTLLKTMLEEHGKQILHGISAADYFRLREYLRAEDETAGTELLSPPVTPPPKKLAGKPCLLNLMAIPQLPPPDVILQCPNGTEYHVHSLLLIMSSPILGERIRASTRATALSKSSDAQITNTTNDAQLPTLEVDVDSLTLSALLTALYGENSAARLPSNLYLLGSVLVAVRKFGMAHVAEAANGRWDSLAASSPAEAYFVAIEHGLTDYARSAARKVLESPIAGVYVGAMESGTALTYHNLLEYYRACARIIDARMKAQAASWSIDINTSTKPRFDGTYYCTNCFRNPTYVPNTYLSGLATKMDVDTPGTGCSFDLTLPALLRESSWVWPNCVAGILCRPYVEVLMKISAELPEVLADAIAEVQLEIQ